MLEIVRALRRRKAGTATYEGFVEDIGAGSVKGWCVPSDGSSRRIGLRVILDGREVASGEACLFRTDLAAAGYGTGMHGFMIEVPGLKAGADVRVIPDGATDALIRLAPQAVHDRAPFESQMRRLRGTSPWYRYIPKELAHDCLRAECFPQIGPMPWLDRDDHEALISAAGASGHLTPGGMELCRQFARDGFCVIEGGVAPDDCDLVWTAFDAWTRTHPEVMGGPVPDRVVPEFGRLVNVHRYVPETRALLHHPLITGLIDMLMGQRCVPFQTIPSYFGSEQPAHSDAIHMATFPLGFMVAAWIALEDIEPDSGPLVYYPGSHRLPYVFSKEAGIGVDEFQSLGRSVYQSRYEPAIARIIETNQLRPAFFTPRRGDILIWHHNLIHGGSAVANPRSTRKSLVCHYYADNVLCYHDLSNAAARLSADPEPPAALLARFRRNSSDKMNRLANTGH